MLCSRTRGHLVASRRIRRSIPCSLVVSMLATGAFALSPDTAEELLSRDLVAEAAAELEARVESSTDVAGRIVAMRRLAEIQELHLEDVRAASATYTRLVALVGEGALRDTLRMDLGRAFEHAGDLVQAAHAYQEVVVRTPDSEMGREALRAVERCFGNQRVSAIALVGDGVITRSQFEKVVSELSGPLTDSEFETPEGRRRLLDQMVEERLMADYARNLGIHMEVDTRREMRLKEDRFLANLALGRMVRDRVEVSEEDVHTYYWDRRDGEFYSPARVRGFMFIVADRVAGYEIYEGLLDGRFREMKHEHWEMSESLGGGDLGLQRLTDMDEEWADRMEHIGVDRPAVPFRTERGWEVFYMQVRREGSHTPLDKVREQITGRLRVQKEGALFRTIVDSLRTVIPVEVLLNAAPEIASDGLEN